MDDIAYLDVDDVWRVLGRGGRYQVTQFLILMLAGTPMAFHILSVVFIGSDIDHVCNYPAGGGYAWSNKSANATPAYLPLTLSSCSITMNDTDDARLIEEPCPHGYNYSQPRDRSFVSEWDLVCDKEPMGKLSQTLVMAGMMVGASLLPQFGDKYGRKKLQVLCHVLMFIIALAMAFNTNFYGFLFLRFAVGVAQHGYLIPLYIHVLELFPANLRELIGLLSNALWAVSIIIITLIGYIARNYSWRTMQIILSVFSVFSFIEIWILDESLRWLVANKKHDEVIRIIKKACRKNNKDFTKIWQKLQARSETNRILHISQNTHREEVLRLLEEQNKEDMITSLDSNSAFCGGSSDTVKPKKELGHMDLLRNRTLRPYILIMLYTWLIDAMTYYGLTLLSSKLAGNVYVNFLLGGLLEIPADILMLILLKKIGRKKTVIFFHIMVATCLLVAVLVSALAADSPAAGTCLTVFSLAGRFAIAGSFNTVWIYTPEILPTNIRNVGVGLSSTAARIGGMASPFFNSLASIAVWAPAAIFCGLTLLVTFLITFLPETTGRELPQTLEELEEWKIRDKKKKRKDNSDTIKADEFQFEKI